MGRSTVARRISVRIVAVLALVVWALGAPASPASAWSMITPTSLSAPQGATITISGFVMASSTCPPGALVQLTSTPAPGGTDLFPGGLGPQVPLDTSGSFKATFVIPASTPVGAYTIGFRCGGTVGTTQTLTVTAGSQVKPSISVSPTSAQPGTSVTISGVLPTTGALSCPSSDATQLTSTASLFPPDGFGPMVSRDTSGKFHTSYAIPSTATPRTYSIGMRCGGGNVGVAASLQVTAVASTTTTTPASSKTTISTALTTTTTAVSTTTVPATTTPSSRPASAKSKSTGGELRWVALGALVLVALAGAAHYLVRHRRAG